MVNPEIKPSLRMLKQIAFIERFCGGWDRISQSTALASEEMSRMTLLQGVCSMADLDFSTNPLSTRSAADILKSLKIEQLANLNGKSLYQSFPSGTFDESLRALLLAHEMDFDLDADAVQALYACIVSEQSSPLEEPRSFLRSGSLRFHSPDGKSLFPAVSGFLVEQRLNELIAWADAEFEQERCHPLLVIGVFQLLFLQMCPFPEANHRTALAIVWHLLKNTGYNFVCYRHFAPVLLESSEQYFNALRQAEKTASSNWSTLNIWLEYFLDTLCICCQELNRSCERMSKASRLSAVQRDIIEVIKENGSATREVIVSKTGINLSTVKYNLSVLASNGHLKRHGGGRTTSYSIL